MDGHILGNSSIEEDMRVLRNRQGRRSSQHPAKAMGTVHEKPPCEERGFCH